ncbi:uncharacterized protein FIBRA_09521 [Fibroporia radiculosa]|uniref:Uncharacterized protein n=1 Tax=Fibroporia radiculosa TaxID=599839 RepID=J7RW89_9APHY|nr:uncharacterized protein FIBRA_09521 [Fibroporia radiculosa]CCM07180.1 predicted protein [Fibroporia radiculosa]
MVKTYTNTRHAVASIQHRGARLFILIQKDGALQFIAVIFSNITNMISLTIQTEVGSMTFIVDALTTVLVSRFILSIRAVNTQGEDETTFGGQTTLQFANASTERGVSDNAEGDSHQSGIPTDRIDIEPRPYQCEHEASIFRGEHLWH